MKGKETPEIDVKIEKPDETDSFIKSKVIEKNDELLNSKKGSQLIDTLGKAPIQKNIKDKDIDALNDLSKTTENLEKVDRFNKDAFSVIEKEQDYINHADNARKNLAGYTDNKNELFFDKATEDKLTNDERLDDESKFDSAFDKAVDKLKDSVSEKEVPAHKRK
jgi:subtilisin family serine protease